jgi:hypothetical protein
MFRKGSANSIFMADKMNVVEARSSEMFLFIYQIIRRHITQD